MCGGNQDGDVVEGVELVDAGLALGKKDHPDALCITETSGWCFSPSA